MRLTNRDKSNLERFGCTFLPKENVICIEWGKRRKEFSAHNIATRMIPFETGSGPIFCLALEISPTKTLAHYCYFPFDLKDETHRKYLSAISDSGKVQLRFLAASDAIEVTYEMLPARRKDMAATYAKAISNLENCPAAECDFERAVAEFERKIRIASCFQYSISESDLQNLVASSKAMAKNAPPEERAQAAMAVDEFLKTFQPRYDAYLGDYLPQLPSVLQVMSDIQAAFKGNSAGFAEFLADLIVAYTPKKEWKYLEAWPKLLDVIFKFVDATRQTPPAPNELSSTQGQTDVLGLTSLMGGENLSIRGLRNLFSVFDVQMGGRPGRPAKDYSAEYELRASGKKWREVADYNLQNDSETRKEFSARDFHKLTQEQRLILMHRVREGIRSFAKRTNKPFPPQKTIDLLLPSPGERENPA
jgi:hypothetical protein